MRYLNLPLLALLLTGCNFFYNNIEFTGTTPGMDTGIVLIKDQSGKTIYGATIVSGKFHIRKQLLARPGYYTLSISAGSGRPKPQDEFEIYLQKGEYTITTGRKGMSNYPIISTTSKIQNELSDYYPLADSIKHSTRGGSAELLAQLNGDAAQKLSPTEYNALLDKVKAAQNKEGKITETILATYVAKYPQSEVAAHVMAATDYESDAVVNYKLFQKFSEAAKNSEDGQEIGDKLSHLVKMVPGAPAPAFAGTTPDGKKIDIPAMHKKVILVEFWRAGIQLCRKRHQTMLNGLLPNLGDKGFGIISVSMDEKRDWWTSAIKDDKMTWPQVSDGKGLESAYVENWAITDLPTYCLLDGTGHIIEKNTEFDNIMFTVNDYLAKHK